MFKCARLIEDKMIAHSCTAELLTWLLLISLTFLNLRLIHTVTSLALNLYIVRGPRAALGAFLGTSLGAPAGRKQIG